MPNIPPVVLSLLAANAIMFALEGMLGDSLIEQFALWPYYPSNLALPDSLFAPWQLVTYAFLHDGLTHLFFNMFALWMFGSQLEVQWGPRKFVFYYFFCVVGAG